MPLRRAAQRAGASSTGSRLEQAIPEPAIPGQAGALRSQARNPIAASGIGRFGKDNEAPTQKPPTAMETLNSNDAFETPARNADELMRLALAAQDPATRLWRLMWARGFRMLASLGGDNEGRQS